VLIEEQIRSLPASPGVYLFKDAGGRVLYVGKAARLRDRVRSYFASSAGLPTKTQRLIEGVADIDFLVTDSEQEAVLLECNLIKKYRPRYNVRLKDDKSYPYLKIDLREPFARIYITRRWEQDGARYFGPFASAGSVRQTLQVLKKLFPFRNCKRKIDGRDKRACIEYDIHRCWGPCIGAISREEYDRVLRQVMLFLEGRDDRIKRELRLKIGEASERLEFERAAVLRDQLMAVESITERQKVSSTLRGDLDVVALARFRDLALAQVFFIRGGKLLGREPYMMEGVQDEADTRVTASFVQQFYASSPNIPPTILLQHPVEEPALLEKWLEARRGGAVALQVPRRGEKKELVDMVAENARQGLEQYRIKQLAAPDALGTALAELKEALHLPHLPLRIECYDISNIQGAWAVGSMAVFDGGMARRAYYRRFRIRTVAGADDYAMLEEVLRRRFRRAEDQKDTPWGLLPDLLLVDGGRGQLNAALEVLKEKGLSLPTAAIAKEKEELYLPDSPEPISLPRTSPALYLVQRIRDEAHRFALSYHVKVRRRAAVQSALDSIPGIGPKRKKALLRHFGSLSGIRQATLEELVRLPGMTQKLAEKLKEYI
jgi:excinuclease ABC subunit C